VRRPATTCAAVGACAEAILLNRCATFKPHRSPSAVLIWEDRWPHHRQSRPTGRQARGFSAVESETVKSCGDISL
jgi:hypothetical protein